MSDWPNLFSISLNHFFGEIYDQVEKPFKKTDWCKSLVKISRIYANKEYGYVMDKHFLEQFFCIICKDRAHIVGDVPKM